MGEEKVNDTLELSAEYRLGDTRECNEEEYTHTTKMGINFIHSGWCATGKAMKIWGKRRTASCPRCSEPVEDTDYILLCQAEGFLQEWDTLRSN